MVPDGRPVIATPTPVTNFVDVPGASGQLDMSEALTGYPLYGSREGSLSFIVLNDYEGLDTWSKRYAKLCWIIHGKRLKMTLEDDPKYFYEGRFTVNGWNTSNSNDFSKVEIGYTLDPYRYCVNKDTISFSISNSTRILNYARGETLGTMPTVPEIKISNVSNGISVRCINDELNLDVSHNLTINATYRFPDMILSNLYHSNVECTLQFTGTGDVEVTVQNGDL